MNYEDAFKKLKPSPDLLDRLNKKCATSTEFVKALERFALMPASNIKPLIENTRAATWDELLADMFWQRVERDLKTVVEHCTANPDLLDKILPLLTEETKP
jgi:hypothetical protein